MWPRWTCAVPPVALSPPPASHDYPPSVAERVDNGGGLCATDLRLVTPGDTSGVASMTSSSHSKKKGVYLGDTGYSYVSNSTLLGCGKSLENSAPPVFLHFPVFVPFFSAEKIRKKSDKDGSKGQNAGARRTESVPFTSLSPRVLSLLVPFTSYSTSFKGPIDSKSPVRSLPVPSGVGGCHLVRQNFPIEFLVPRRWVKFVPRPRINYLIITWDQGKFKILLVRSEIT
ncbi:Hypothetical protein NTJ_07260 [Nesidiocoris tenuis]|uniref:Uncharacterized protein n=1 Tax=Nesidiocoris tenuis TaxID=355587 RepID=A0ABN7AQG4_9HEMI|nr:Hypothetical protein NTJ_07260 [Nesidiocoris tenuis]